MGVCVCGGGGVCVCGGGGVKTNCQIITIHHSYNCTKIPEIVHYLFHTTFRIFENVILVTI